MSGSWGKKGEGKVLGGHQNKQIYSSGGIYMLLVNIFLDSLGLFRVPGMHVTENVVYLSDSFYFLASPKG